MNWGQDMSIWNEPKDGKSQSEIAKLYGIDPFQAYQEQEQINLKLNQLCKTVET